MVFIRATEILSKKATHSRQNLAHNGGNTEGKAQANVPESLLQGILLRQIWEEIHTAKNTPIGAENNPSPPNSQGSKDNQRSDFSADFSLACGQSKQLHLDQSLGWDPMASAPPTSVLQTQASVGWAPLGKYGPWEVSGRSFHWAWRPIGPGLDSTP